MPEVHALLSASGSSRWLACPPSARLEENFPNTTSDYAKEGTLAHSLAELTTRFVLGEINEMTFEDQKEDLAATEDGQKFFNEAMVEHAESYATLVKDKLDGAREACEDAFAELEVRVDFSKWVPQGFGTSDAVIVSDNCLEIIDLKYGKGHRVSAQGNPQMQLYALGAIEHYKDLFDIKMVRMTIFQPRLTGGLDSAEITVKDLYAWANKTVKPTAKLAYNGKGDFNPSDEACKFCRAKAECKARYEANLKLFDERDDPSLITPEQAGEVLAKAKDIKDWLTDLEGLVFNTLMSGEAVEGWKLVEGRSNRRYTDEIAVAKAMRKAGYKDAVLFEKKLLTITKMEETFGKKKVQEIIGKLIEKPEGKPTLAPMDDKRLEIKPKEKLLEAFDEE